MYAGFDVFFCASDQARRVILQLSVAGFLPACLPARPPYVTLARFVLSHLRAAFSFPRRPVFLFLKHGGGVVRGTDPLYLLFSLVLRNRERLWGHAHARLAHARHGVVLFCFAGVVRFHEQLRNLQPKGQNASAPALGKAFELLGQHRLGSGVDTW